MRMNGAAGAHRMPRSIERRRKARREGTKDMALKDLARTAKAAVYEAPNAPFILKTYPLRGVKAGEVLVKVTMSTICRSDIHSYEGRRPNPCPGILGHEIIGVIEEIGAGIEKDMRGNTRAVWHPIARPEHIFPSD